MATIIIDCKTYEVPLGKNVLETCLNLGFDVPYFCWHPGLGSVGACRQCAVKVFKDADDKKGRLVMSCMEPVVHNQHLAVHDADTIDFRKQVIEWLMTNHPHDCAVCDEGGSCHLQDMTVMTGHHERRFTFNKRTYKNQDLGPFLNHEMNRCIQCYRCVRFYKDYAGGKDLDAYASKNNVYFGRAEDGVLENEFSGNLAEICPTGVFTDKTLKEHYTRKWDLTMSPSICQHCSVGCNTIAGERYGALRMIHNRFHEKINGYFLCDRGRFGYEFVNAENRIKQPSINGDVVERTELETRLEKIMKSAKVIGIGSPRASLQSNFALKTLVGEDNFYHGVSDHEHDLAELAVRILKDGPVRTPSTKEIEKSDAIFVLGEDLTNTAPIVALAVRQAVRQDLSGEPEKIHIQGWQDAARKNLQQQRKMPLYSATIHETKLDDICTSANYATPEDIARLGFAVAHCVDHNSPAPEHFPEALQVRARSIANGLLAAKNPTIISGAGCASSAVMKAAANVAIALHKNGIVVGLTYTMLECNSMGLTMIGGHRLSAAFNAVINGHADTLILLENDLFRHGSFAEVGDFLARCKNVIVLDHTKSDSTDRASVVIPAGTFAESDGIIVNNEGRAQRFFQVYESTESIQESWRWIINIGKTLQHPKLQTWQNFEDISKAMASEEPMLQNIDEVNPAVDFRIVGQRIPREPHRFSGRTSMHAHIQVSEQKPPTDDDSPLSYTMEGTRIQPPSAMIPFYWSPGWNSVQSVAKYQHEVGGSLKDGDSGIRLLEANAASSLVYFQGIPEAFVPLEHHLWIVPTYHIFGSEEMSAKSASIQKRIPTPYLLISAVDANIYHLKEQDIIKVSIANISYSFPIKINRNIPVGMAALPYGLCDAPINALPEWGIVETSPLTELHDYVRKTKVQH
ncbi:NADH-quinone oxidoreductase subunit NuoG [Pseudochryseolinea flava]|uniref:NADH-quinone oxidoreductase subunit G n=1 Tax=Pseudochryseolinea flava TaxID=2059302 RepID=A0A364Y2H4_9BACT|nr:NADH-quinone oxidoreductase subunit NuoG [Pseudochryseolinea flava]RAW00307.1 NADH-quinone oxidoreductase subunit G [Pseudochryseolinea flava]